MSSPELAKLGAEVVEGVDVATDAGIAALVKAVGDRSIDLLVNNAGILVWRRLGPRALGALNVEGIRKQFEVNALAPLRADRRSTGDRTRPDRRSRAHHQPYGIDRRQHLGRRRHRATG